MTRRTAILLGLGAPIWAASGKPFWDEKDPEKWTDDERQELLTRSPWARAATVHFDLGPGGLTGRGAAATTSRRGRTSPGIPAPSSPGPIGKYEALVRWDSALPIREASKNKSKDDPAANYILSVTGDLPMLGRGSNDESEAEFQQRLEMLKQYTKLEKHGDPIYLSKMAYAGTSGTLFYFERNYLIRLQDHTVTFVTKLGPVEVQAKFPLKEMVYRGKLEL